MIQSTVIQETVTELLDKSSILILKLIWPNLAGIYGHQCCPSVCPACFR